MNEFLLFRYSLAFTVGYMNRGMQVKILLYFNRINNTFIY